MTLIGKTNSNTEIYRHTESPEESFSTSKSSPIENGAKAIDTFEMTPLVSSSTSTRKPAKGLARVPEKAKEFAVSLLTQKISPGFSINLPEGFSIAIKMHEQPFTVTSKRVADDEIKTAYSQTLLKERGVRTVIWFETGGIFEMGLGVNGTIPLALFCGVDGGFKASGLLSYQQMQPVTVGSLTFTSTALKAFCPRLPFSAESAASMPPGSEFSITGQGAISLSGKLSVNAGAKICNIVSRVASASAGPSVEHQKTYGIKIYSQNGKDKIRVTLTDRSSTKFAILAAMTAGIDVSIPTVLPTGGKGILQSTLENPIKSVAKSWYDQYTRAALNAELSTTHVDLELCTFDMDLSIPNARVAYEQMLKLSPADAIALSFIKGSGVKMVKVIEHEDIENESLGINFFGAKLLMIRALETEKNGVARRMGGPKIHYRETRFDKEFSWWFSGQKKIVWETVTVLPDRSATPSHYCHLQFTQKNYVTKQKEVNRFFTFADLMGVHRVKDIHSSLPHLDKISKLFTSADDTQSHVDIYITEKGLEAVKVAGYRKAFYAFSRVRATLKQNYRNLPWLAQKTEASEAAISLLATTIKKNRRSCTSWVPILNPIHDASSNYYTLTNRDLKKDIAFFEKAESFGYMVEALKTSTSETCIESWFTALGRQQGFDFMATLAALQELSSPDEFLVHELNLKGGGICLQSLDEGMLKAPSIYATDLLIV